MSHTVRLCLTLAVLVCQALLPATASADTLTDLRARISQAQASVKDLSALRQGQQKIVEQLRGASNARAADLRRVDAELTAAVSRYRQAEASLAQVEAETRRLEGQIAEQESAVQQRADVYSSRLRALYKFTRTSPLEQLLGAQSFSEALQRMTMMQAVARVDNRLLGQLRQEYAELMQAREALAQKHAEAAALRNELDSQRRALEQRRAEQASLANLAQQEQRQAEGTLSELDREAQAQSARIVGLQAQYQRQIEEVERQRQEAARREALRQEELRRQAAQATATAQAQAAARTGGTGGAPAPRPPATLPGTVNTAGLQPSSYNMIWPVNNPVITAEYGVRTFAQSSHTGIDLAQRSRTPILAAADGVVLEAGLAVAGKPHQSYGMMVTIAHGGPQKLSTLYAHLDVGAYGPTVRAGQTVRRGEIIGYIGMTGITSGPHLHFEVRENGQHKNPRLYLPK